MQELNDYKERINENDKNSEDFKKKIQKLFQENSFLTEEHRTSQENLRLSNAQQQKILNELNDYKNQIDSNDQQNDSMKKKMQGLVN